MIHSDVARMERRMRRAESMDVQREIAELTRKLKIERAVVRACRDHVLYCVCAGHRVSFKSISDAIWIARRKARRAAR